MKVYVPMTANILTAGHIKFIETIRKRYKHPIICVGLLTDEALKGYKKVIVPYKDREYIISGLRVVDSVVPQNSLDPYKNLMKTGCMAIASGDGWEKVELNAIDKWIKYHTKRKEKVEKEVNCKYSDTDDGIWKPQILNIKLKGERNKKYSSSKIIKICKNVV